MQPDIHDITQGVSEAAVQAAAQALRAGELVLLPTETVYGLTALPGHADRLRTAKGRAEEHPFTLHLADPEVAEDHATLGRRVRRVIERHWPGPVTVVVAGKNGGTVGLRVPDHDATRAVLRACGGTALMTSANRTGEPPAPDPATALEALHRSPRVVLDAGALTSKMASTVLDASGPTWRLLRAGDLDPKTLLVTAATRVLFVCTGNTCRSPLAEAYARRYLAQHYDVPEPELGSRGIHVGSAGVAALDGMPASAGSLEAGLEVGLDLSPHRAHSLEADQVAEWDRIYCLSASHADRILHVVPDVGDRLQLLAANGSDIADPFGGSIEVYREARDEIQAAVRSRLPEITALVDADDEPSDG